MKPNRSQLEREIRDALVRMIEQGMFEKPPTFVIDPTADQILNLFSRFLKEILPNNPRHSTIPSEGVEFKAEHMYRQGVNEARQHIIQEARKRGIKID